MNLTKITKFVTIVTLTLAGQMAQAQAVKAPIPAEGNSWEFRTINLWSNKIVSQLNRKTIGISGDYIRTFFDSRDLRDAKPGEFVKPQVSEATQRADLNATYMYKGEKGEQTFYKWPLEPGKKWEYQYKSDYASTTPGQQTNYTSNTKAEVLGWENVEVPAGKFKTIKIVYKNTWVTENPSNSGSSTQTGWYCPETKSIVQSIMESFAADGSPQTREKMQLFQFESK